MATIASRLKALEDAFKAFKASGGVAVDYGPTITGLQAQVGQIPVLQAAITALQAQDTALGSADTAAGVRLDALEARPDIKVATSEPTHDGSQKDKDLWVKKT